MDEKKYIDFLVELHRGTERQGPGTPDATARALGFLPPFQPHHRILDVGCGTGASTRVLWTRTPSQLVASDFFPLFLRAVDEKRFLDKVADRVDIVAADMSALPFDRASFDLIWSEGAIYIMGFETGLNAWRPLLKTGGYIAVSELSFLRSRPSKRCVDHWKAAYPGMASVTSNLDAMVRAGYDVVGHFTLPKAAWTDHYYASLKQRLPDFEKNHGTDPVARFVLEECRTEMAMFDRFSDEYNYEFYIGKRR